MYTPPQARGRGYATALVAALSQALLDEGRQRLFLITDLANPVSNSIYAKIGYRPQSDLFHFDFVDANERRVPQGATAPEQRRASHLPG